MATGLTKAKLANEDHYLSMLFLNSQPDETGLSPAHKLFNCSICTNVRSVKPQPKSSTNKTVKDPETQNCLSTLKPGDTFRIGTDEEKGSSGIRKDQFLSQMTALARTTS